jgi:hypothetical protein
MVHTGGPEEQWSNQLQCVTWHHGAASILAQEHKVGEAFAYTANSSPSREICLVHGVCNQSRAYSHPYHSYSYMYTRLWQIMLKILSSELIVCGNTVW